MSIKKTFLLIILSIISFMQAKLLLTENKNISLKFLTDQQNSQLDKLNQNFTSEYIKNNYDWFFHTIKFMNPIIFGEMKQVKDTDQGFKVRCFWVDSKTLRVFDLSQLKSIK